MTRLHERDLFHCLFQIASFICLSPGSPGGQYMYVPAVITFDIANWPPSLCGSPSPAEELE